MAVVLVYHRVWYAVLVTEDSFRTFSRFYRMIHRLIFLVSFPQLIRERVDSFERFNSSFEIASQI